MNRYISSLYLLQAESGLSTSPTQAQDNVEIMRTSVIVAMIMLLKANLKSTYGLSEE